MCLRGVKGVSMNPTRMVKETIASYLSQIEDEEFRLNLFFHLSDTELFLFNIYQNKVGFLSDYKGLRLKMCKSFLEILEGNDEYEHMGTINPNHPFLYGNFVNGLTSYMKKIYIDTTYIGLFEFVIKKGYVSARIKDILNRLMEDIKFSLLEIYLAIKEDMYKRLLSLNALNLVRNERQRLFYHSFRVADLSLFIAKKMNLTKKSQRNLYYAALIHDLGELYIPKDIYSKKEVLTDEEKSILKEHPKNLKRIFSNNPFIEDVVKIAYYHHERMDGRGYYGYKKDEIPIESRILALCEVVDGMYTDRPDRKVFNTEKIVKFIRDSAIDVFDEDVVKSSIDVIRRFYTTDDIPYYLVSRSISNEGKPATVLIDKNNKRIILQGAIGYVSTNTIGISLYKKNEIQLSANDIIRIQFLFLDTIYDFKATVISADPYYVNAVFKELPSFLKSNLNVFWEFNIIAIPLKVIGKILDGKESKNNFIQMKSKRFGSQSLSARMYKTTSSLNLNIGDTVILKMKPLKDIISVPAVVTNVVDKEDNITIYFEYFSLPEDMDAKIHQAIYYKQSQQNRI